MLTGEVDRSARSLGFSGWYALTRWASSSGAAPTGGALTEWPSALVPTRDGATLVVRAVHVVHRRPRLVDLKIHAEGDSLWKPQLRPRHVGLSQSAIETSDGGFCSRIRLRGAGDPTQAGQDRLAGRGGVVPDPMRGADDEGRA